MIFPSETVAFFRDIRRSQISVGSPRFFCCWAGIRLWWWWWTNTDQGGPTLEQTKKWGFTGEQEEHDCHWAATARLLVRVAKSFKRVSFRLCGESIVFFSPLPHMLVAQPYWVMLGNQNNWCDILNHIVLNKYACFFQNQLCNISVSFFRLPLSALIVAQQSPTCSPC